MWLKDKNGALYLIAAITSVAPLEYKDDKRDQTKVTRVCAALTTAGGNQHHTELDFQEVVKLLDPPAPVVPPAS